MKKKRTAVEKKYTPAAKKKEKKEGYECKRLKMRSSLWSRLDAKGCGCKRSIIIYIKMHGIKTEKRKSELQNMCIFINFVNVLFKFK